LFIFSNEIEFKKKFSELDNPLGIVINSSSSLPSEAANKLSLWLKKKDADLLTRIREFRGTIADHVEAFFNRASIEDKKKLFSYSSKVILSIEKYAEIQQIFLIHAFLKKNRSSRLVIFCDDREINDLLANIFLKKKRFHLALPSIYAWLRFIRTLLRVSFSHQSKINANRVILTLAKTFPLTSRDNYFGDLPVALCKDNSTAIISICAGKQILFNKKSTIIPLESFSHITDVLNAWIKTISQSFLVTLERSKPNQDLFFYELSRFIKNKEIRSGSFFYNSFLSSSFQRLFFKLAPSTLIYPFENRSWEKSLLRSAYKAHCLDTVGYQHSSITPRHLSLKISKDQFNTKEFPKRIITVGDITYNWLKKNSPMIANRLIIGGSLRKIQTKPPLPKSRGILVAISSSFYEAKRMLLTLSEAAKAIDIPVIIRSHPTIDIEALYNSLNWSQNVILSKDRDLLQDIKDSHVIIYSSSTVAIEGMLSGRLPIFLNIGDCPSGDPLLGRATYNVSSVKEIKSVLNSINNMTKVNFKKMQRQAIKFAQSYLKDIEPEEFLNLL
jgi:hypothetical protein